jgi:hypothetical protein
MPTPITTTTETFTYNIADVLYSTSTSLARTATATYEGPDRIWVFVDSTTGLFSDIQPPLTSLDDGADVPTPVNHRKVEVVAADDPIVISMIREYEVTYADVTETTDNLPDGSTCVYNSVATLGQTYDMHRLVHDGSTWSLGSLVEPHVTWTQIIDARNGALTATDGKISPDQPDAIKQPWITYRQALRDLPATFNYGDADEIEAWKVNMPATPED